MSLSHIIAFATLLLALAAAEPGLFTYWGRSPSLNPTRASAMCSWFDHKAGVMYLYGGAANFIFSAGTSEMWKLNLTGVNSTTGQFEPIWTEINATRDIAAVYPANASDPGSADLWPGGRSNSHCVIDFDSTPGDTLLWMYGGLAMATDLMADLWYYSVQNGTWRFMAGSKNQDWQTGVVEGSPGPRNYGSMFLSNGSLYFFGGYGINPSGGSNWLIPSVWTNVSVYSISNNSWSMLPRNPASQVLSTAPAAYQYFSNGDYVYAFSSAQTSESGAISFGYTSIKYQISNNTWLPFLASGTTPSWYGMTVVSGDPASKSAVVYGASESVTNPFYAFDFETQTFTRFLNPGAANNSVYGVADPSTLPNQGSVASAAYYRGRMFLFGGIARGVYSTDLFTYEFTCPNGTQTSSPGLCTPCLPGSVSLANSDVCTPCQLGYTSLTRSSECYACPEGSYGAVNPLTSLPECRPCAAGTFNNVTAQTSCTACSSGLSSSAGSPNCSACGAGLYSNDATSNLCVSCVLGRIPNVQATDCVFCVGGTTTVAAQPTCSPCDESNVYSNATTSGLCNICPRGSISTADKTGCQLCPAGSFHVAPRSNACALCTAGNSSIAGSTRCSPCVDGTYSNEATRGLCQACPAGFVPSSSKSYCVQLPAPVAAPTASAPVAVSNSPAPVASAPSDGSSVNGGNNSNSGVNTGAIAAAIVLGILLALALIALVVVVIVLRKKKAEPSPAPAAAATAASAPPAAAAAVASKPRQREPSSESESSSEEEPEEDDEDSSASEESSANDESSKNSSS